MKNKPKWLDDWERLTGDHKYLEIKGWYTWQEKSYTTDYIRDYFGKDEDPDYYTQSFTRRWMMDWLRRQRGRMRHTLYNNPTALLQRMNATGSDCAQAGVNLLSLVSQGFLMPTNEQIRDQKYGKESKINQITPKESITPDEEDDTVEEPVDTPVEEPVSESKPTTDKSPSEILAAQFFKALGQPKKFRNAAGDWEVSIKPLLENFTPEQLSSVIKFALEDDDFILGYLNKAADPMATFVKNIDSIRTAWETEEKVRAARAKKASKSSAEKAAPGAHGNKDMKGTKFL
jgi:hypothetical protein